MLWIKVGRNMFDKTLAERLQWLRENKRKADGERWTWDQVIEALKGTVSRAYLYKLLSGERTNPSLEVLEALSGFFGVPLGFFSRTPQNFLPPVPPEQVQMALRDTALWNEETKNMLDRLSARAPGSAKKLRGEP